MVVKYTTTTKVKAFMGDYVAAQTSDADLTVWIEEAEGYIDTLLKIGSGTGSGSLTFDASKKPHLVLELAATAMAASIAMSHSTISTTTMEQAVLIMQTCIYWFEKAERMLIENEFGDFIKEQ